MRARISALSLLLVLFCSFPIAPAAGEQDKRPGARFQLFYRALQPGEVLLLKLIDGSQVSASFVSFMGKKHPMAVCDDQGGYLTLIGLDMGIDPGIYPLKVVVRYINGQSESTAMDVTVTAKAFPEERLWVEEKFVTPPREEEERIRWESELLRSIYSVSSDDWLGEGAFILPLEGRPSNNFGKRRIFNNVPRSPHSGQDIGAPAGTPVAASNSGRVVLSKALYFSGNTVIIDHGLGVFTYYCHFSEILVKRGDRVSRGDLIGRVGATGRVTGPHLHWSVRIAGSRVDPYSLTHLEFRP